MRLLERFLAKIEVKIVLKLIEMLSVGTYYLKYATIEDFIKYLENIEVIEDETDDLIYREMIIGVYKGRIVELHLWSCGISIFRYWVSW